MSLIKVNTKQKVSKLLTIKSKNKLKTTGSNLLKKKDGTAVEYSQLSVGNYSRHFSVLTLSCLDSESFRRKIFPFADQQNLYPFVFANSRAL